MSGQRQSGRGVLFLVGVILFLCGAALALTGAVGLVRQQGTLAGMVKTEAVITDMTTRFTWISYSVNGEQYEARLNYYSSAQAPGDALAIYYNPENPAEVEQNLTLVWVLLLIPGGATLLVGVGLLIHARRSRKKIERLLREGRRVAAEVVDLHKDFRNRRNYRYGVVFFLRGETGLPYQSDAYFGPIPENILGTYLWVYVDPNNPERYYVDLSPLERRP